MNTINRKRKIEGNRRGGQSKSSAKVEAARQNGMKSAGRPTLISKMTLGECVALTVKTERARCEAAAKRRKLGSDQPSV